MAKFNYYQSNFTAGEVSPRFGGRFDTQQFQNSVLKMENMLLMPQGGAIKRPGFRYLSTISNMTGVANSGPFLIDFIVSKTEGYAIALCPDNTNSTFIKIFNNTGALCTLVIDSFFPVVPTTLFRSGWHWAQSADILWITHNSGKFPHIFVHRTSTNNFYIGWAGSTGALTDTFAPLWYPFLDANIDPQKCLRPSAVSGSITLFAETSAGVPISFFLAAHVGANFKLTIAGITGVATVTAFTSVSQVTAFVQPGGTQMGGTTRTDNWEESAWSNVRGWPRSVCFYQQRLVFGGTVFQPDTVYLSLVGNPFHFMQLRLAQDATTDTSGLHFFGTIATTDPFSFTPTSKEVNPINWVASGNELVAGTLGGEFVISGGGVGNFTLLSSQSIQVQQQTSHGSSAIAPVRIDNNLHFITREGKRLLDFQFDFYSNNFKSTNLSLTADHIPYYQLNNNSSNTSGCAFFQMAYQESRNILWVVNGRGSLTAITINREAQVIGWHTHNIGGGNDLNNEGFPKVTGICILPNAIGTYDEVYACIQRTINGAEVFYLEHMPADFLHPFLDNSYFSSDDIPMYLDSSTYQVIASTNVVTGLGHLEGQAVVCLALPSAGPTLQNYGTFTIAGGQITLPENVVNAIVGLPYYPKLYTQKLEAGGEFGSAQGNLKRIDRVAIKFDRTYGAKTGVIEAVQVLGKVTDLSEINLENVEFNVPASIFPSLNLFSGEKRILLNNSNEQENIIVITQTDPLPMTVLGITYRGLTND